MNMGYFGRDNATSQYFTAVGTPDGKPHPQNTTRWRVFCHTKVYNSSEGGPCTWRPLEYGIGSAHPSCFAGFDKNGNKMVDSDRINCFDAWIDEKGIEHNPATQPSSDENIDPVWTGEFGLSLEYGKYIIVKILLLYIVGAVA